MEYSKKSVTSVDVKGKKVLLRCDFNIPLDKETGEITDEGRITASLKTINYLLDNGAAVIACSHLGRPKGQWNEKLSLKVVAERLSQLLGREVKMAKDVIGEDAKLLAARLQPGEIMLLENLRFHKEEEANDPQFARALASMADIYVSDSFGTAHRAHASTAGVADYLPAYSGFLLAKELRLLGGALTSPLRPFVAILGGAKVSDKLGVIRSLLDKADTLILGGAMAYTFIKAQGGEIGASLCEEEELDYAREMLGKAKKNGVRFLLPPDTVCAKEFKSTPEHITVDSYHIPEGMIGLDIGPKTIALYQDAIMKAATVIWNGPMGVFEFPEYEKGTHDIAEAMARTEAVTIIGGGDSVAAARQFGYADQITLISTGGGASLEFLEGKALPGVTCLLDKE
ncbi:MAG: phosphoglycerate kinase [Oscillospiraceae bacterium]|nr:phosphoglycerate kinase [Oscillospiraceae bacterium]